MAFQRRLKLQVNQTIWRIAYSRDMMKSKIIDNGMIIKQLKAGLVLVMHYRG